MASDEKRYWEHTRRIKLPKALEPIADAFLRAKQVRKLAEETERETREVLKKAMGGEGIGILPSGTEVVLTVFSSDGYEVEATVKERLTVTKE